MAANKKKKSDSESKAVKYLAALSSIAGMRELLAQADPKQIANTMAQIAEASMTGLPISPDPGRMFRALCRIAEGERKPKNIAQEALRDGSRDG